VPLDEAALYGHTEVVRCLLEYGADPSPPSHALLAAASKGYLAIIRLLLQAGADPNYVEGEYSESPLSLAAIGGHSEVYTSLYPITDPRLREAAEEALRYRTNQETGSLTKPGNCGTGGG
jgi:ankyrin repeat protein